MYKSFIAAVIICMLFLFSCVSTPKGKPAKITLSAVDAQLKTTGNLVYEEGPDRDNIGWWEKEDDEIIWTFDVADAGEYKVTVKIACDPQFAGSTVGVTVAGETLPFKVPDTGDWSAFIDVEVGSVKLDVGSQTLVVKGITLANRFFGNLQAVVLQK
ncbi:MAG: hypothetical protein JXB88_04965 [Spirochaetales bacterium]|nr:hypothetical protein [Spirochaetales bacterium]